MRLVIPSVGYADFLGTTLPAWRRLLPQADIRVVTDASDVATAYVAGRCGVECIVTDAWQDHGAVFNKAAAIDAALGSPAFGEVCLVVDADVVPFGGWPVESSLRGDVLYGVARFYCPDVETLEAHRAGLLPKDVLALILPRRPGEEMPRLHQGATPDDVRQVAVRGLGYFQCFRYRASRRFGSSSTAAGYDSRFARTFPQRAALPGGLYVLHLGELDRRNWSGRVVPAWQGMRAAGEVRA